MSGDLERSTRSIQTSHWDNLDTYIQSIRGSGKRSAWENLPGLGGTNNEPPVMEEIVDYFKDSKIPVYVVFITDGGISKTRAIKDAIRRSANHPSSGSLSAWVVQATVSSKIWMTLLTAGLITPTSLPWMISVRSAMKSYMIIYWKNSDRGSMKQKKVRHPGDAQFSHG